MEYKDVPYMRTAIRAQSRKLGYDDTVEVVDKDGDGKNVMIFRR